LFYLRTQLLSLLNYLRVWLLNFIKYFNISKVLHCPLSRLFPEFEKKISIILIVWYLLCYRIGTLIASMDDRDRSSHATANDDHDDDMMNISLAAEIKEEFLDDADVNSHLSDVETEDDGDVVIVDAEKTMQYLSGIEFVFCYVAVFR